MSFKITLLCLAFLVFGCEYQKPKNTLHVDQKPMPPSVELDKTLLQKELDSIDTHAYCENYIIHIINNGSNGSLGFKGGVMDAGIATKEDAPNIARYVMNLARKKSSDDAQAQKAQMFYTSNCGGCHGNDGKGLNGAFPDLTLKTLRGIEKRKAYLIEQLNTLP